jgi:ATP-dependent Lon protease
MNDDQEFEGGLDEIDTEQITPNGDENGDAQQGADEDAEVVSQDGSEDADDEAIAEAARAAQAEQVSRSSRAQDRIRRQQEELQRERQARESAERERQLLLQQLEQQRAALEQARQQQYLEALDPAERQAYLLQQRMEQMQREMQQQQFSQQDMMDKIAFQQRAMQNPMVGKYADRVEQTLLQMRAKGQTAPRESILKFLVGEDVLTKAPASIAKATKAASKSTSKPLRARGNAAPGAPDEDADLEERLSRMTF